MCGIAGLLEFGVARKWDVHTRAAAMGTRLFHRGPDANGIWSDPEAGIALSHQRLSIIDVSDAGAQPMTSSDGRWVISYNGEIYNCAELARELNPQHLRGHSDTEILLEACARWGVEATLERAAGMFAFALWDRRTRTLWIARDRLGIKPLYVAIDPEGIAFASELKALAASPTFKPEIDMAGLGSYLRHGCFPAPTTIFANTEKLQPGHLMRITHAGDITRKAWWPVRDRFSRLPKHTGSDSDIENDLDDLLRKVVNEHLLSDVPVGAFLSGGIDSSLVVSIMKQVARGKVSTFSIGFEEERFNEADAARAIAEHLGTDHHELTVSPRDAMDVIPSLAEMYDEPFSDSSQIPTYLVSKLAGQSVTVALSGDGGDEGFAGYTRYTGIEKIWNVAHHVPAGGRKAIAGLLRAIPTQTWDAFARAIPASRRPGFLGDKIHKGAGILDASSVDGMYRQLISQWAHPEALTAAKEAPFGWSTCAGKAYSPDETIDRLRLHDIAGYLHDDILTKVDRASMALSLEVRVPLLDHRVVEFGWQQKRDQLIRNGRGKSPLRRVLSRYVPEPLFDRPKSGFGIPLGEWLQGPLRDWAEDLLSLQSFEETGLVAAAPVRARWEEHLQGARNWQQSLWTVLMLQQWSRHWGIRG